MHGADPMSRGKNLQSLIAEQWLGPHDMIFVPSPSVPKWISERMPERFEEMIFVKNDEGQIEQMHIETSTVGEVVAEGDEEAERDTELREILIPICWIGPSMHFTAAKAHDSSLLTGMIFHVTKFS